jgi:hypothetical protein
VTVGEIENHTADFASAETQIGINACGLEFVELREYRLGNYEVGTRIREQRAWIGEQDIGVKDDCFHVPIMPKNDGKVK